MRLQPRTVGDLSISDAMRQMEVLLRRVANIDSSLLITGESGVGKEAAAKFVHQISTRADEPFVAVNCGAIPNDLIESQLFGHERGAFTTSRVRRTRPQWHPVPRRGRRAANADAGEAAPPDPGARLHPRGGRDRDQVGRTDHLRDQYRPRSRSRGGLLPTGSLLSDQCDSCRDPASSRRSNDILPLTQSFIRELSKAFHRDIKGFTAEAEQVLLQYSWPGNVRELRNRVERGVAMLQAQ